VTTTQLPGLVQREGARTFDDGTFDAAYASAVVGGPFQEETDYYRRYESRYRHVLRRYAGFTGPDPVDVCEIGGGQHALLAAEMWGDRATVGDLFGPHHEYLASRGVSTLRWDLTEDEMPFTEAFDRLFLCEVIAHVAIPPHVYLERLRSTLRPGGKLVITTPNLHRLRNLAFLALGKEPWQPFARTQGDHFIGMFLDFSPAHLTWQLETAGYRDVDIELVEYPHQATTRMGRIGNAIGRPLTSVPRLRSGIVAVATA
jgi:SAM-dependent methyltransferase